MYIDDTIAAIATPPGIGGVGIIRVSGKDSFPIVNSLFKSAGTVPLMDRQNRTIQYGTIVDPGTNKTIDEVLVLLMKGPHSYTAEDVVEIHRGLGVRRHEGSRCHTFGEADPRRYGRCSPFFHGTALPEYLRRRVELPRTV